jgi:hypothetical protein
MLIEWVGNFHSHTRFSDGTATHRRIAEAAAQAGLDGVAVTDHNVWVKGLQGYYGEVLLLVGEEVHDPCRQPQVNHALILGLGRELAPLAASPQALIDAAREQGALVFLAHPVERSPGWLQRRMGEPPLPWVDREVSGFTGLEVWNTMSEFKARLRTPLHALYYAFFPARFLRGPFPETLRWWEQLWLQGIPAVAIGGADAHGHTYALGPLRRVLFPYEWLFRAVRRPCRPAGPGWPTTFWGPPGVFASRPAVAIAKPPWGRPCGERGRSGSRPAPRCRGSSA